MPGVEDGGGRVVRTAAPCGAEVEGMEVEVRELDKVCADESEASGLAADAREDVGAADEEVVVGGGGLGEVQCEVNVDGKRKGRVRRVRRWGKGSSRCMTD